MKNTKDYDHRQAEFAEQYKAITQPQDIPNSLRQYQSDMQKMTDFDYKQAEFAALQAIKNHDYETYKATTQPQDIPNSLRQYQSEIAKPEAPRTLEYDYDSSFMQTIQPPPPYYHQTQVFVYININLE